MSDIIKLLPDSVANQIAAGEVIQRPASVVKELVENSIDAGASSVTIIVKDAGRTLIQVVDNGRGMSDTDARMAFERHATSKISSADDLFTLHTMGFRGEALASICAVSQVDVRTMTADARIGTRIVINGSRVASQAPEACVPGTNIMVKNLFFNIPARRKFLKKDVVEMSAITREFERLALVNTAVDFTLVHNDVTIHSLRRAPMLRRISDLFGKNLDRQLIPVETETSIVKINGYIGLPENARRRNALQYLTVNGRNMRHPVFHKAVMQCYEQLIPADVQPNYFIDFSVDPASIDVNIHPTKNEIKFENEQAIRQILIAAVKESLGRFNAVPSIDFEQTDAPEIPVFNPNADVKVDEEFDPSYNPFDKAPGRPVTRAKIDDWEKLYDSFVSRRDEALMGSSLNSDQAGENQNAIASQQGALDLDFDSAVPGVMQLKNRFIMSPCREGVMIVEQNRAHQRVLFERYLKRSSSNTVNGAQRLIFPENIRLSPSQNTVMETILPEIEKWGFEIKATGETCEWSVTCLPAGISETSAREMIYAILDDVASDISGPSDDIRRVMAMAMARTAAVKSGQPLSRDEIDRLMSDLLKLPAPGLTPDGRRTFAILTTEEIIKMLT